MNVTRYGTVRLDSLPEGKRFEYGPFTGSVSDVSTDGVQVLLDSAPGGRWRKKRECWPASTMVKPCE
jgi:hypothetical protein